MNRMASLLSAVWIVLPAVAGTQADDILGLYWNPDRDRIIEIYLDDRRVYGRVVWSEVPPIDTANPTPSLRGRNMLGVPFLTGFRFDGERRWTGGRVYAPDNGRSYRGTLWLRDGDLKMRGFVGVTLLGRTATFVRYPAHLPLPRGGHRSADYSAAQVDAE